MSDSEDFKAGSHEGLLLAKMEAMSQHILALSVEFRDFKQGMGSRLEQNGKDIAVIIAQNKVCDDERKTYAKATELEKLERAKNWFVMTIIAGFVALIYSLFRH